VIGPFCARQARFGPRQAWTIKAYLIGIKGVGKVQHAGAAGIPAIWRADPGFPPSKANDDKFLVFMVLKCCVSGTLAGRMRGIWDKASGFDV
jgi:hypothetical protein